MYRRILRGAAGATLALALVAGPVSGREPTWGIPGDPNCEGQTTALFARVGAPGIGNSAKVIGLSVKELKAMIREFCTPQVSSPSHRPGARRGARPSYFPDG